MRDDLQQIHEKYNMVGDGVIEKYALLQSLASKAPNGIFCEVGFRKGTGMASMLLGRESHINCYYIGIDPYGNIPYKVGKATHHYDYTTNMKMETMKNFFNFVSNEIHELINFTLWNLESTEFFKLFPDGVIDYGLGKRTHRNDYALVHLDGQHDDETLLAEIDYFKNRILPDGFICIDNTEMGWMDMAAIEKKLFECGFESSEEIRVPDKWAYRKRSE